MQGSRALTYSLRAEAMVQDRIRWSTHSHISTDFHLELAHATSAAANPGQHLAATPSQHLAAKPSQHLNPQESHQHPSPREVRGQS